MKSISLFLFTLLIPILAFPSPNFDYLKYPKKFRSKHVISIEYKKGFSGDDSYFFYIKCRNGREESFLYEPKNSHRWFTVPAFDDPIYSDLSPESFAAKMCAEDFNF